MSLHHNREQAIAELRSMPEQCFIDGLLLDVPKRRRREQAMGTRPMIIQWPKDQKKRFGTQVNRFIEKLTKELGLECIVLLLERPKTEDLPDLLAELLKDKQQAIRNLCEEGL